MAGLKAVIIAGPMKTGTTALALGLSRLARAGRLPRGVVFPLDSDWPFISGSHEIVKHSRELRALTNFPSKGAVIDAKDVEVAIGRLGAASLASESHPGDNDTVVFVWEGLAHVLGDRASDLKEFDLGLSRFFDETLYVIGIRSQDQALRSLYAHQLRGDRGEIFEENLNFQEFFKSGKQQKAYDYALIYKAFSSAGIARSFVPMAYDENHIGTSSYLLRFFLTAGLGLADVATTTLDGRLVHPSLSLPALSHIGRLRRAQARFSTDSRVFALIERVWTSIRAAELRRLDGIAKRELPRARSMRFSISEDSAAEIRSHYEESNRQLLKIFPRQLAGSWLETAGADANSRER